MQATALAHPNIALVKYWGKQDAPGNRPAVPSLSMTLDSLWTRTRIRFDPALSADTLSINGVDSEPATARTRACLDALRQRAGRGGFARVETQNNFPTGAGLASSASGFAALVVAASRALELDLPARELARIARRSSGSAARSMYGGFVEMPREEPEETAYPLLAAERWPLSVVVAITTAEAKDVGSSEGMTRTAQSSDYYAAWVAAADTDFTEARDAVLSQNFDRLARVSERSCLKMHALMLSADPGLIYWNEASVACLHRIRALRAGGAPVFFTMDAGPQVKAICAAEAAPQVAGALAAVPGVARVLRCGLGSGARLVAEQ